MRRIGWAWLAILPLVAAGPAAFAQNAEGGRANTAITGGFARVPAATATNPAAADGNRDMTESERGETYKSMRRLIERSEELRHAEDDLEYVQTKYEQQSARSTNARLNETERSTAAARTMNYGKLLTSARTQRDEFRRAVLTAAQMDERLKRDETRKLRNALVPRPEAPRRRPNALNERNGLMRFAAVRPMNAANRIAYEQRLKEWKERVKMLEARNPAQIIKAAERKRLDLSNHLASPVLTAEARIRINEAIRESMDIIEQKQTSENALWDARRTVYQIQSDLRRDDEIRLRIQSAGIFSNPDVP